LGATLELLGEVGFDALRVDEVAQRSEVNKTTIYRRWPTRDALVHDALISLTQHPLPERTGDLQADLIALVKAGLEWLMTPLGRGIARVITSAAPDGPLRQIVFQLRETIMSSRAALIADAVADGRLPAGTDARFVADLIHAGVYTRVFKFGEEPDPARVEAVVRVILAGAASGAAVA